MGCFEMLKINMKKINEYLNEIEFINNNIRNYLLESESRIINMMNLMDELSKKILK